MTEILWAGEFGNAYTERNLNAAEGRRPFWRELVRWYGISDALEVGCNIGANLVHLDELIEAAGVDVNQAALDRVPSHIPTRRASASDLPFPDESFCLTFTMGVLIHTPPEDLRQVMSEIVRCSRRYVLCGEYWAPHEEVIPYRGEERALFRRDYGDLYQTYFPDLTLRDSGFLSGAPWDDISWWLFDRA